MSEALPFVDLFLFTVLPYCALVIAIAGTIERYRRHPLSCSSHSSQLLENRVHFWGEIPFHYGLILVLVAHVVVVLIPGRVLALTRDSRWLFAIESIALALGLLAAFGLVVLIARRLVVAALRRRTGLVDWVIYALLSIQILSGLALALVHPWGTGWFAAVLTPYLWSLARFQPEAGAMAAMPWLIKVHVATAFTMVAIFPFSRLVHVVAVPNRYLWRPPQVVRWRRDAAPLERRP